MSKKRLFIIFILIIAFIFTGCSGGQVMDGPDMVNTPSYRQIDQEPAKEMMAQDDGHIIIDWTGETVAGNDDTEMIVAEPIPELVIKIGEKSFYADLEDNSSAKALAEMLSSGEITIDLHDYGNFEKVGDLPWELPRNDEHITTQPGDIILYQGNQITIYYDENTWDFTKLAKISDVTREELLDVLGDGDISASFYIEWSE